MSQRFSASDKPTGKGSTETGTAKTLLSQVKTAAEQPPGQHPENPKDNVAIRDMERKINLLKANSILLDLKLRREVKGRAFDMLRVASARLDP